MSEHHYAVDTARKMLEVIPKAKQIYIDIKAWIDRTVDSSASEDQRLLELGFILREYGYGNSKIQEEPVWWSNLVNIWEGREKPTLPEEPDNSRQARSIPMGCRYSDEFEFLNRFLLSAVPLIHCIQDDFEIEASFKTTDLDGPLRTMTRSQFKISTKKD